MHSALYAIAIPSVSASVIRMDQSKTAEVRIVQFSSYMSPVSLDFHPEILTGSGSPKRARQTRVWLGTGLSVSMSKTVRDTS